MNAKVEEARRALAVAEEKATSAEAAHNADPSEESAAALARMRKAVDLARGTLSKREAALAHVVVERDPAPAPASSAERVEPPLPVAVEAPTVDAGVAHPAEQRDELAREAIDLAARLRGVLVRLVFANMRARSIRPLADVFAEIRKAASERFASGPDAATLAMYLGMRKRLSGRDESPELEAYVVEADDAEVSP